MPNRSTVGFRHVSQELLHERAMLRFVNAAVREHLARDGER